MADQPVRPPTDAELAAIRDRLAGATPGPWHHGPAELTCGLPGDDFDRRVADAIDSHFTYEQDWRNLAFIAHARTDVPALLAAVAERDHLIYVMSRDGDAYQRGVEDGRRLEREATKAWLLAEPGWADGAAYRDPDTVRDVFNAYSMREFFDLDDLPPPLPPDRLRAESDRLRAESDRLREALRGLAEAGGNCESDSCVTRAGEDICPSCALRYAAALRAARAAPSL